MISWYLVLTQDLEKTCLMKYLRNINLIYYGRILELEKHVALWLSYIPATFPHYTSHTINHSVEIVSQLSKLLFYDNDPKKPVLTLSPMEVYILIACAILHDSGMVVSEQEKISIFKTDGWKKFVSTTGQGKRRWDEIHKFRKETKSLNENEKNYVADIQVRFLLAEFIRKQHSQRVSVFFHLASSLIDNFCFNDNALKITLENVCISHGLRPYELLDKEKYPDRRDIRDDTVNVRFMCILLRIGDLLDMSSDRACPLLINAASPLPADSYARWTKYQRIVHRLTAPDKIELVAECNNQLEHRYLRDWCNWLVEEIKEASNLMSFSLRHSVWRVPNISLDGDDPTIIIRPANNAKYIPLKWKFELDADSVYERLIKNVHTHPLSFVKELIQNALDANRCKMYLDLNAEKLDLPDSPTDVKEEIRNRYPVEIRLIEKKVKNELSGEIETKQMLIIEDYGVGMDRYIIENFFLQVGRSYYVTDEFRRNHKFIPTSRFGLGFLSVFSVSSDIKIETYKETSTSKDGPIIIQLSGPKNYFLVEKGNRVHSGTKIEIMLNDVLEKTILIDSIINWCKRVEFPIIINELGEISTVVSEDFSDYNYSMKHVLHDNIEMGVHSYDIDRYGIEGEIYVFYINEDGGERWDRWSWAHEEYPNLHPEAVQPQLPSDLLCINGISYYYFPETYMLPLLSGKNLRFRVDYRKEFDVQTLNRMIEYGAHDLFEIDEIKEEIIINHLSESKYALSENGWKYKNRLAREHGSFKFWQNIDNMLKTYSKGNPILCSYETFIKKKNITLVINGKSKIDINKINHYCLLDEDILYLRGDFIKEVFKNRLPNGIKFNGNGGFLTEWIYNDDYKNDAKKFIINNIRHVNNIHDLNFDNDNIIGINFDIINYLIINKSNLLIKWMLNIIDRHNKGNINIEEQIIIKTITLLIDAIRYPILYRDKFMNYLKEWKNISNIDIDIIPPEDFGQTVLKIDRDFIRFRILSRKD